LIRSTWRHLSNLPRLTRRAGIGFLAESRVALPRMRGGAIGHRHIGGLVPLNPLPPEGKEG